MLTKKSILNLEKTFDTRSMPLRRLYNKQITGGGSTYYEEVRNSMENMSMNDRQEYIVADSMLHTGQEIPVIPFQGIALPMPADETSENYGRRLHAYNLETMRTHHSDAFVRAMQGMIHLESHGLRDMWQRKSINDFMEVRGQCVFFPVIESPDAMAAERWQDGSGETMILRTMAKDGFQSKILMDTLCKNSVGWRPELLAYVSADPVRVINPGVCSTMDYSIENAWYEFS